MSRPRVSVVVRCFNEEEHIGKLLHGITRQTVEDREIVVVDSGSTDGTLAVARRFPTRIVEIEPEAFTFGRALNVGCERADGEFLVFASAHVHPVYEDWLESLLAPFENPDIGAVYGKQRGGGGTAYSERQIFRRLFPDEDVPVQETPFCNNANCAIRRSLWEEIPYDEELTGLEDLHWARRVLDRGWKLSYAADAEVVHLHDETPREVMHRHMREAVALSRIYRERGMSFASFLRLFVQNTVSDWTHAAREGVLGEHLLEIPRFRFMQFWGAYRGFRQRGEVPEELHRRFYYPRGYPSEESGGAAEASDPTREGRRIDYRAADVRGDG